MSTNSNEVDDLMEEGHTKQTKLQKFIRTIDQQTMRAIKKYLDSNQNPVTEKDSKSDKIKLYTDLLIIRRFKIHQNELNNKKKIDELCQELKQETQFSIATIRERIQKKLSNVSKQQIITHINLNLNFAFNTKRKLVPVKSSENNKKSEDQRDITFQDQVGQKKVVPPIQVQSGGEESQVLQVPAPATKQIVPSKKNAIKQEERKIKTSVKKTNDNNLYNEFREISDHDSDQQMLIVKTDNKYKVTTKKGQAMLAQILEEGKKFLQREQQLKNQEPQEIKQAIYEQQDDIIEEKKSEKKSEKESEKESGKQENISNNQQDLFNQKNDRKISSVNERPDEEELKCYCSVEDWKLVQADKTYYYLKWYPDEDAFLREIILNPQSKNSDIQLQVLKKFKTSQNVYNRIRNLKLDVPKALLQKLQIGELD